MVIKIKNLSIKEYLNKIKTILERQVIIINNLHKSDKWKIQLTIGKIYCKRVLHSKKDSIEIMSHGKADKVIGEYQVELEISMKGCDFIFDPVNLLYHKCHAKNLNGSGSCIDSPDPIKSKKAMMNPISKNDNKCLQYAVTIALNYEEIKKDSQRISKIKPLFK